MVIKKEWWENFFGKYYLTTFEMPGQISYRLTNQQVGFVIKALKLKKNDKILDLCCGQGRHSIALSKLGYQVTGSDQSDYLLGVARKRAEKAKVKIKFIKGDARKFKLKDRFDVILNLYTAFGYDEDYGNEKIINNVSKHLKKGGRFFLDLPNTVGVLRNYKSKKVWKSKIGKLVCQNQFDPIKFFNNTIYTTTVYGLGKKIFKVRVRMYTYLEIEKMLGKYKLKITSVYGGFRGERYTSDTKRMIIIAKKI